MQKYEPKGGNVKENTGTYTSHQVLLEISTKMANEAVHLCIACSSTTVRISFTNETARRTVEGFPGLFLVATRWTPDQIKRQYARSLITFWACSMYLQFHRCRKISKSKPGNHFHDWIDSDCQMPNQIRLMFENKVQPSHAFKWEYRVQQQPS